MIKKVIIAVSFALFLAACNLSTGSNSAAVKGDVTIKGFAFAPNSLTVAAGQKVIFANNDTVGHTVTSDDGTSFNTGTINSGQTANVTAPSKPGTYGFHCSIHPSMTGSLVVQ